MPLRDSQPCSPVSSPKRWKIWSWGEEKAMGVRQALSAGEVLTCDCFKTSGDLFLHLKSFSAFFTSYLPYPGLSKCLILQPVMCMGFPGGSAGKESTCNVGDLGSIPALGRSPGEGNGYPLQYSGLENSMDCTVMGLRRVRHDCATFTFMHLGALEFLSCPSCPTWLWKTSLVSLFPGTSYIWAKLCSQLAVRIG